jgi:long-chain acyl-CoA synthetase
VLVEIATAGGELPDSLRFIAVGGAPVSRRLLERAQALGLPVFEGYGLSEAASVVTLNTPQAHQLGSVGKPLPHVRLRIAEDGEIHVAGAVCAGYLGEPDGVPGDDWPTGDIGYLDAEGFLHLTGRKKHIFITAFGRNVSPEWVEREVLVEPAIAQVVVFGEARPFNAAIIVPRPGSAIQAVRAAIDATNRRLPDYARIRRFLLAEEPFSVENGLLTGTARPRRAEIAARYAESIQSLYNEVA